MAPEYSCGLLARCFDPASDMRGLLSVEAVLTSLSLGGPNLLARASGRLDLDEVDSVEQSFVANVYYEARWRDARLAHDGLGERSMPLSSVWHPRL